MTGCPYRHPICNVEAHQTQRVEGTANSNMSCAYDTVKYVHIKDARLGVLRYCFIVAIVAYVVVFEMLAAGGYLQASPVVGVVRFSLQQPTVRNCDPSLPGCFNAFQPLNSLPYCKQYDGDSPYYAGSIYPCEIYEAMNAQIVSESSIAVKTRASTVNQTLVCGAHDLTCSRTYNNTSLEHKFYTAQSESFAIMFDHAVTTSKICTSRGINDNYACSSESSDYQGRLYSKSHKLCEQEHAKGNAFKFYRGTKESKVAPCYVNPNQTSTKQDFFSLDILLKAAGVDLDSCNGRESSSDSPCRTYRESGATMLLNIYWSDFNQYNGLVEPYYYYSPQLIVGSSFKQYIPIYDNYRQTRTLLNAHGIKVAVLLGGEFNQFNVVSFLVTLTTALGLLAVATTIVDMLMLYILPEKKRYQEAKFESTEEFQSGAVLSAVAGIRGRLVNCVVSSKGSDHGVDRDLAEPMTNENDLNEPLL
jgi:hypothetical protein